MINPFCVLIARNINNFFIVANFTMTSLFNLIFSTLLFFTQEDSFSCGFEGMCVFIED